MAVSRAVPGKVVITGCDSGLGRAFATQYAVDGRDTVAIYLDPANRTSADTANLLHRRLDVTAEETVADLACWPGDAPVSLLICNAGQKSDGLTDAPDFDAMTRLFEVNALGALRVSVALLPHLAAAAPARIVLVSSRLGGIGSNLSGGHVGYRASKARAQRHRSHHGRGFPAARNLRDHAAPRLGPELPTAAILRRFRPRKASP